VLKKTAWLLSGRIVSDALSFVFYIALARRFGESGMGDYAFAFALVSLVDLVVEFGLKPLVTREVAKDPNAAKRYCGNLAVTQAGIAALGGLGLSVLVAALGYSSDLVLLLSVLYIGSVAKAIGRTFAACLEAIEAMDKSAKLDVISRLTIVLCGLALLWAGVGLPVVISAYVLGGIAYLGLAVFWAQQRFGPLLSFQMDSAFIRRTLYAALPFLGASGLYEMYARVDVMMIHHFIGDVETGRYAVAYRLVAAAVGMVSLVGVAMYPALSRGSKGETTEQTALFLSTLKWVGALGVVGAVILVCVGDGILVSFFSDEFTRSGELIRWMSVLFFVGCVKVPYERLLLATNGEYLRLRLQGLSVALNVALNLFLIPTWGAYGAVWASIISEVYLGISLHISCARVVPAPYTTMASRIFLGAGGALAGGILMRGLAPWPVILVVVVAALVVALVALQVITAEDQRRIGAILSGLATKTTTSRSA
jgi:O-antigen/teichoic acid export membrane protein